MVGKKSSSSIAKDQGLERTDNDLEFTSWPQVNMINQKNYYTEYLKRDDQVLVLRLQNEESRNRMTRAARDKDRALAQSAREIGPGSEADVDLDETVVHDAIGQESASSDVLGSKIIVIHPGSQNLRVGLASDILPKTVPMIIARKSAQSECEETGAAPRPKRRKLDDDSSPEEEESDNETFAKLYMTMTADLKARLRKKGRRIVPNSREQAVAYNRKAAPEIISEHNDSHRIDWTDVSAEQHAPEYFTGQEALRIPDFSTPRYKLYQPIRHGLLNEKDYQSKTQLMRDLSLIIEDAIKSHVGIKRKSDWSNFDCVFIIPDLYERCYVTMILDMLFREFAFARVCFIQESVSASFGAGYSTCVVVDVGAEKTSICCVDEGMCVESSRINLAMGGADVTEAFIRMLLHDQFPYYDMNLQRRYDLLLAEELKQRFCTFIHADVSVHAFEFYLRAFGEDTRHYSFKTYDEVMLAPMGFFQPEIFNHAHKYINRRTLVDRSYDLYDGSPNDPVSSAQSQVIDNSSSGHQHGDSNNSINPPIDRNILNSITTRIDSVKQSNLSSLPESLNRQSPVPSTGQDGTDTPLAGRGQTPIPGDKESQILSPHPLAELIRAADVRDQVPPLMKLDKAIISSIENGAKGDERKMRDFFGGIIPVGGGSQVNGFTQFLEEELVESQPDFKKEVIVALPPREIDPQVLVWKGASVFGKLEGTNDSWISGMEYDRLGSRVLAYKCLWSW